MLNNRTYDIGNVSKTLHERCKYSEHVKSNLRIVHELLMKRPYTQRKLKEITGFKETTIRGIIHKLRKEGSIKEIDIKTMKKLFPEDVKPTDRKAFASMDFNPEEIELRSIATQPEIYALEVTVNDILSKWKVKEDSKKQYFAFGRELLKIKKKFHPNVWERPIDYRNAVRNLGLEWNKKKLNKEILKDISRAMGVSAIVEFLS